MEDLIEIIYTFRFDNGSIKEFTIHLDRQTLAFILERNPKPPVWAELNYSKCANRPFDKGSTPIFMVKKIP